MESYDVVTIGAATLDLFMRSDKFKVLHSDEVEGGVAICEVYGGKMEVEQVQIVSGGGGTNTAVSFAKKELKTASICEMGNDPAALIVYKDLEEAMVDTRYVVQEQDETTAVSTILISHDGGRSVIVYRGASAMLGNNDIPWDKIKSRWIHISSLGGNIKLLEEILNWAKKTGARVSCNPGMMEIKQREKLLKLMDRIEIIFLNKEEARELFKTDYVESKNRVDDSQLSDSRVLIITDSERGGVMREMGKWIEFDAQKSSEVMDTTGAGDAFASGMVSGVLYGMNYEQALVWGAKNAAGVIREIGAKKGLLSLAEVK